MVIRPFALPALFGLALLAAACYESPLMVGSITDAAVDPAFIGTWTCVDPKDASNRATLTSRQLNPHQYEVEWRESPGHVTRYHVHATAIGGERLFNVKEFDPANLHTPFAFVKARLGPDRALTLAVVEANAVKPHQAAAAIRLITSRVADPALYGPFATCAAKAAPATK